MHGCCLVKVVPARYYLFSAMSELCVYTDLQDQLSDESSQSKPSAYCVTSVAKLESPS